MLDLLTIFTKGGIVLWCFRETKDLFAPSVNALIRSVIVQERSGSNTFDHQNLTLQYKMDNEFELIFVVAYQRILQLAYVDKFLSDVHLAFRDKYKNVLAGAANDARRCFGNTFDFGAEMRELLRGAEEWQRQQAKQPKQMRSFDDSVKSKKTVASMIEKRNGVEMGGVGGKGGGKKSVRIAEEEKKVAAAAAAVADPRIDEDTLMANRRRLAEKLSKKNGGKKSPKTPTSQTLADAAPEKKGKQARVWELGGNTKDLAVLDRSKDRPEDARSNFQDNDRMIGTMRGVIQDLAVESSEDEADDDDDVDDDSSDDEVQRRPAAKRSPHLNGGVTSAAASTKKAGSGVFALFKGLVGAKNLTVDDMQPALDKLRDHLIGKNVASDIAYKLCDSVAAKLEGKVLGTFDTIAATIKTSITDALVQILSPRRRVDILRDCLEAQRQRRPFVMAFCGVNGVGKSTNLAKICFWLIENNLSVLIAACDTFRAGAVEQLRTHTRHLNALHPAERHNGKQMVQLYEKGYGKDAAGIAMEAIRFAGDAGIDVVLVDTAGRMQDNEPLMRALGKLIRVNEPDLVLFVGEALVGNEAVDQLVKFNQALADYSGSTNPHTIDGIVLTKFDTIDDKVGAAISMTYITGQPIVFVGTGQTYTDLKALNAKAVVQALMK